MQVIKQLINGVIIGIANIIPGVSGGTLALVLGIYERLIAAIHNVSLKTITSFFKLFSFRRNAFLEFKTEMKKIDFLFLLEIIIGAAAAIVALAQAITWLLIKQHDPTYGFFFGLVLASIVVPYKLIKNKKSLSVILAMFIALGGILALDFSMTESKLIQKAEVKYELTQQKEINSKQNLKAEEGLTLFLAGAIAISAMILPGVSGSFLMILMGKYFAILQAIADHNWLVLLIFAFGCLFGILAFTKLLNFLLKRWQDQTMGFLTGLVLGSTIMIWPFKHSTQIGGETIYLKNMLPQNFGQNEILTLVTFLLGILIISLMILLEKKKKPTT